jgi:CheY-like chemotaxis protein
MGLILFLDDMQFRHDEFDRYARGMGHDILHVETAADAITLLGTMQFDQVFLDHDLSVEDIMVKVGAESAFPTGMAVVDHIVKMENPPPDVIVHSCNGPAREEMVARLEAIRPAVRVRGIPFPDLIQRLRASR